MRWLRPPDAEQCHQKQQACEYRQMSTCMVFRKDLVEDHQFAPIEEEDGSRFTNETACALSICGCRLQYRWSSVGKPNEQAGWLRAAGASNGPVFHSLSNTVKLVEECSIDV